MPVNTKAVQGRRTLHFNSVDDILADVERLNQGKVKALGNWSPGQILKHLAAGMNGSIDGLNLKVAWWMRMVARLMKKRFLTKPMPPGFRLPADAEKHLVFGETSWEDGLSAIRTAIGRLRAEAHRHPSPILGELTREEADQLQCRHAELHLSFLIRE